jgi:two-component system response regulator DesR
MDGANFYSPETAIAHLKEDVAASAMSHIRTILADAADLARSAMAQLLALEPDITVVGEYDSGTAALAAVYELHPDVAVLDSGVAGSEIAERVAGSGTRVVIMSSITASVTERTGVSGHVARTAPSDRLADAVRTVAAGRRFVDVDLADESTDAAPLTPRERTVLRVSACYGSLREISQALGLSVATVGLVMNSLLAKTGGRDRSEAARIAHARGWV